MGGKPETEIFLTVPVFEVVAPFIPGAGKIRNFVVPVALRFERGDAVEIHLGFGILVIGGGELYIENVYRISEGAFVLLREDYNSVFDGDLIIKNCRMGASITSIVQGRWRSFDCGLPNYMFRSVTIEGLTSESSGSWGSCKIYVYQITNASKSAITDATNPLYLPTSITVSGVESGALLSTTVSASKTSNDAFSTVSVTKK